MGRLVEEPDRGRVVYLAPDGRWVIVDVPFGLIPPPTIVIHEPLVATHTFYYADMYNLPVPPDARAALEGR